MKASSRTEPFFRRSEGSREQHRSDAPVFRARDLSLRLKNGSGQDDFHPLYSAPLDSPNKIIRIEMLPKSNPSYGYDTASRSSVLPMQYSSGR